MPASENAEHLLAELPRQAGRHREAGGRAIPLPRFCPATQQLPDAPDLQILLMLPYFSPVFPPRIMAQLSSTPSASSLAPGLMSRALTLSPPHSRRQMIFC